MAAAGCRGSADDATGDALRDGTFKLNPITYGHTTRTEHYPIYSAPHPVLYWLHQYGRVLVGKSIFEIRFVEEELASWLEEVGIEEMSIVAGFRALFGVPSDLGPAIAWASDPFDENNRRLLWEQIAGLLEGRRSGFDLMRPIWGRAATESFVPLRVPTAAGPQPISTVFVN